ncbi:MAG TPA: hypothetical protein VFH97_04610, partial [Gemmatimonadales bacterium]|nr:hypothetical protein [Gemmatimonadales bacterium]
VNDVGNSRFDLFLEDGTFAGSFRRRIGSYGYSWWGGVDRNGLAYDQDYFSEGPIDRTPGVKRQAAVPRLLRFDPTGRVDSLPLPSEEAVFYRFPSGTTGVPFAGEHFAVFDPRGYVWVGTTSAYRIHQTRFSGDTVRIIERPHRPIAVSAQERARAIEGLERLKQRLGPADLDYSAIPAFKPAIEALDPDDGGRLWVRPVDPGAVTVFDVFDSAGTLLATARAGFRVRPHRRVAVRGTMMVTVVTDSLGVDYMVIARVRP